MFNHKISPLYNAIYAGSIWHDCFENRGLPLRVTGFNKDEDRYKLLPAYILLRKDILRIKRKEIIRNFKDD